MTLFDDDVVGRPLAAWAGAGSLEGSAARQGPLTNKNNLLPIVAGYFPELFKIKIIGVINFGYEFGRPSDQLVAEIP